MLCTAPWRGRDLAQRDEAQGGAGDAAVRTVSPTISYGLSDVVKKNKKKKTTSRIREVVNDMV